MEWFNSSTLPILCIVPLRYIIAADTPATNVESMLYKMGAQINGGKI